MNLENNILNLKVSYQDSTWADLSKDITILDSLNLIQSSTFKKSIETLRNYLKEGNKAEYDKYKLRLPAVTFCATFKGKRRKDFLNSYNSIIVIDIDKLDSIELENVWNLLEKDPLVLTFWKSPSNQGIKGLVQVQYDFEIVREEVDLIHKSAFEKLSIYFKETYEIELDKSGSDTTRLCFFSYDNDLILKNTYEVFQVFDSDILINKKQNKNQEYKAKSVSDLDALYNPLNRNNPRDRKTIGAIIKYLEKRKFSITTSYENWYKVAMSISNSFSYDVGLKYFKRLSAIDESKYNEEQCAVFLQNCYISNNGSIKFITILYLANEKGYLTKEQKEKGT